MSARSTRQAAEGAACVTAYSVGTVSATIFHVCGKSDDIVGSSLADMM